MTNDEAKSLPEPEECDWCGKVAPVKFENLVKAFCSAKCANFYLESEGFTIRVTEEP